MVKSNITNVCCRMFASFTMPRCSPLRCRPWCGSFCNCSLLLEMAGSVRDRGMLKSTRTKTLVIISVLWVMKFGFVFAYSTEDWKLGMYWCMHLLDGMYISKVSTVNVIELQSIFLSYFFLVTRTWSMKPLHNQRLEHIIFFLVTRMYMKNEATTQPKTRAHTMMMRQATYIII
jgi:hypothetical protein